MKNYRLLIAIVSGLWWNVPQTFSYPWKAVKENPQLATGSNDRTFNQMFLEFYGMGSGDASRPPQPNSQELLTRGAQRPLQCQGLLRNGSTTERFAIQARPSLQGYFFVWDKVGGAPVDRSEGAGGVIYSRSISGWYKEVCDIPTDDAEQRTFWHADFMERNFRLPYPDVTQIRVATASASVFVSLSKVNGPRGDSFLFEIKHGPVSRREDPYGRRSVGNDEVGFAKANFKMPFSHLDEVFKLGGYNERLHGSACVSGSNIIAFVECN